MSPVDAVVVFTGAALLVAITPGPDMLVVLRALLIRGTRAGMQTAGGVCLGVLLWGVAAATGLAALLAASPQVFRVLQVLGACYLIWLGIGFLRRARYSGQLLGVDAHPGDQASGSTFRTGLLTNLLNPKIGVFYVGFLPPFLPEGYPPAVFGALLAGIHAAIGMSVFATLAVVAHRLRFPPQPPWQRRLDTVSGAGLCGFGTLLLFSART